MITAFYFKHPDNFRNTPAMAAVRGKYGNDGYMVCVGLMEIINSQEGYVKRKLFPGIAKRDFDMKLTKFEEIIKLCIDVGLIEEDPEKGIFVQFILDDWEARLAKIEKLKTNEEKKKTPLTSLPMNSNAPQNKLSSNDNLQSVENYKSDRKDPNFDWEEWDYQTANVDICYGMTEKEIEQYNILLDQQQKEDDIICACRKDWAVRISSFYSFNPKDFTKFSHDFLEKHCENEVFLDFPIKKIKSQMINEFRNELILGNIFNNELVK